MKERQYFHPSTQIRLNGGEPFLHPNLLHWVKLIKEASGAQVGIFTNGFWLRSQKDIEKHYNILKELSFLLISQYPGRISKDKLLLEITDLVPIIDIPIRNDFYKFEFSERRTSYCSCGFGSNPHLLPDGRLMRCPVGFSILCNQTSHSFANTKDMFFDLKDQ
jgi:hypothetical protein